MKIQLGEIYKNQHDQILRVLGGDELEVFYESYWSHDNSWGISSSLNRKASFYRMDINAFLKNSEKTDFKEFSSPELDVIRPDLPIRIGRVKDISWDSEIFHSEKALREFLIDHTKFNPDETIATDKIWLYPTGVKGGFKKAELVQSKKQYLSTQEILLNAAKIKRNVNAYKTDGIGIYRLGIEKKNPSYYIGEYIDMAGILNEGEAN